MTQSTIFIAILALTAVPLIKGQCTITSYDQVASAVASCSVITINSFTVPANKTLLLALQDNAKVNIQGKITFAHFNWVGPLMEVRGKNVAITGSSGVVLDGLGSQYWDGQGDNGVVKPKFLRVETTGGSTFNNVDLLNCPHQCISVQGADTTFLNCNIDISAGDSLGKNTDGFDISGNGITITGGRIHNQDDCVVVNKGSKIRVSGLTCIGGHGLSISAGVNKAAATISDVIFSDSNIQNSRNAIHVKTHTDAPSGTVTDVHYNNITMSGITHFGINVQQNYKGGTTTPTASNNIKINRLNMNRVVGTMSGGSNAQPVFILCGSGSCTGWNWSGVSITNGGKTNECSIKPTGFTGCP